MSVGTSTMKKSELKSKPLYWNDAVDHLSSKDKVISEIIRRHGSNNFLIKSKSIFKKFFKIIVGQQISIEAAKSIEDKIKFEETGAVWYNLFSLYFLSISNSFAKPKPPKVGKSLETEKFRSRNVNLCCQWYFRTFSY